MKNKGYEILFSLGGGEVVVGEKVYYGRCANGECWVLENFKNLYRLRF